MKLIPFFFYIISFIWRIDHHCLFQKMCNRVKIIVDDVFFQILCFSSNSYHFVHVFFCKCSFSFPKQSELVIWVPPGMLFPSLITRLISSARSFETLSSASTKSIHSPLTFVNPKFLFTFNMRLFLRVKIDEVYFFAIVTVASVELLSIKIISSLTSCTLLRQSSIFDSSLYAEITTDSFPIISLSLP